MVVTRALILHYNITLRNVGLNILKHNFELQRTRILFHANVPVNVYHREHRCGRYQ